MFLKISEAVQIVPVQYKVDCISFVPREITFSEARNLIDKMCNDEIGGYKSDLVVI